MKIVTVLGARPQFIKAYPFSREVRNRAEVREVLVHTGQHYDYEMSKVFFEELDIPTPDHHLEVGSGNHGEQTARILERLEPVLLNERPDVVIVYGDTNSTLAGALAAAKLHIPVAHVEAGLRSFNRRMPEELNRVVADHLSNILFCPTPQAVRNLAAEGLALAGPDSSDGKPDFDAQRVYEVPDIMQEALALALPQAQGKNRWLDDKGLRERDYYLFTLHRPENTDHPQRLGKAAGILRSLVKRKPVVFPIHPRTLKQFEAFSIALPPEVIVTKPVGYLQMLWLERQAAAVLTDSGGVQKEACWLGRLCLTLRTESEWVELVQAGLTHVVDLDEARIMARLDAPPPPPTEAFPEAPRAARNMLEILVRHGRG